MTDVPTLDDYPLVTSEKLRFADMDRQGHVNNVAFMVFLENARCEVVYDEADPLSDGTTAFVVARIGIDFKAEMTWPGTVEIGTRVGRIGKSSIGLEQALFQDGKLCGLAETVVVLTDVSTRRSTPLPDKALGRLARFQTKDDVA